MKKLPHEKLREAAKTEANIHNYYPCVVAAKDFGAMDDTRYTTEVKMLNAIADEIEKYYIPRPRFDDGEPVHFDDRFYSGYTHAIETVSSMKFTPGGFKLNGGLRYDYGEPVRRCLPEPKVLDADGVETKVGDTVWSLKDSTKWEVTETHPIEPRISLRQLDTEKEVEGGWFLSSEYSHREPDSLEKLRDDILDTCEPITSVTKQEWADRLTAIMERDA